MVWPPTIYGQSPCNVFEVPQYPMPPAAPCPQYYGDDSIQTIFLLDPVNAIYSYCDQGLVTDDPSLHVLEFMQAYLNACAREALPERCYYTGDFFSYGFNENILDRTKSGRFYQILYSGTDQTDHRFDQNYKDFAYTANDWKRFAPSGNCPFGFNSEWLIDAFELRESPGTGNVELRVTYKRVCCPPPYHDSGSEPSTP